MTSNNSFQTDLASIEEHYSNLLVIHGDSAAAVQWRDQITQERRFEILTQVGNLHNAKVLDFGCGTGHLLHFLRSQLHFNGEYVGYDLSHNMIAAARQKFPEARFEQRNILTEKLSEDFDYVLISGVFNNIASDNWGLMTTLLKQLFQHTKKGLAFNALSTYVDYFDPHLFYVNPEEVFRFLKEYLSPCVTLRHDYQIKPGVIPFEFSAYIYSVELEPKKS